MEEFLLLHGAKLMNRIKFFYDIKCIKLLKEIIIVIYTYKNIKYYVNIKRYNPIFMLCDIIINGNNFNNCI